MVKVSRHFVDNGAGTELAVKRIALADDKIVGRPVLIIPGYGMNSFIFGFHPGGPSLEESLALEGIEVFSADLRAQGLSKSKFGKKQPPFGLAELAVDDVARVIDDVHKRTGKELDLIGCSLGTALMFAYLAHHPNAPVRSIVSFGGLVSWVHVPLPLRIAFASPRLMGAINIRGARKIASWVLPFIAKRTPGLLSIYINPASSDLSRAAEMVQTVEDPRASINEEIAHWMARRDLVIRGINVSQALASMHYPLLCVVARNDGIVPVATARGPYDEIASTDKELLFAGDDDHPIAHADLFLSREAREKVFLPIARFLKERYEKA